MPTIVYQDSRFNPAHHWTSCKNRGGWRKNSRLPATRYEGGGEAESGDSTAADGYRRKLSTKDIYSGVLQAVLTCSTWGNSGVGVLLQITPP